MSYTLGGVIKWEKLHLEEVIPEWGYVMGKVILATSGKVKHWKKLHPGMNYILGRIIP